MAIGETQYKPKVNLAPIREEIQRIKDKVDGQTDVINNINVSLDELTEKINGFVAKKTEFLEDGSIKETSGTAVKTTTFIGDGSIKETLIDGEESITKVTKFLEDGSIEESIQEDVG